MIDGPKNTGTGESEQFEALINELYWELPQDVKAEEENEESEQEDD